MALQDLTPQLRTRLSRMERAVGWFVFLATALLLFGFGYYIYQRAQSKGWFKIKAPFHVYVQSSAGLKVGDDVVMMGFAVGQITLIHAMEPRDPHNVRVEFQIREPYFRYIWSGGSVAKITAAGFLNQRQLEVTRGTNGYAMVVTQPVSIHTLDDAKNLMASAPDEWQLAQDVLDVHSNLLFRAYDHLEKVFSETNAALLATANFPSNSIYIYNNRVNRNRIVASWDARYQHYKIFTPGNDTAWLPTLESPALTERLEAVVEQVQGALPGILALTNKLATVLGNAADATSNLNLTVSAARPMLTNFAVISGELREPGGALTWALGTNGNGQFQGALTNVNSLLTGANTNLNRLTDSIGLTLENLAGITSNLNAQVQSDPNLLYSISKTIADADDFVQGLKHHWLLRSAFKDRKPDVPEKTSGK